MVAAKGEATNNGSNDQNENGTGEAVEELATRNTALNK